MKNIKPSALALLNYDERSLRQSPFLSTYDKSLESLFEDPAQAQRSSFAFYAPINIKTLGITRDCFVLAEPGYGRSRFLKELVKRYQVSETPSSCFVDIKEISHRSILKAFIQ